MGLERAELGVWLIECHGQWRGFALQADTTRKRAVAALQNELPRLEISRIEKVKGLVFRGKPRTIYSNIWSR